MKYKLFIRFGIVFILIGAFFASGEHVYAEIDKYYKDITESKNIVSNVNDNYTSFKNIAVKYKNDLENVSTFLNIYLQDYNSNKELIDSKLNDINDDLELIYEASSQLINYCKYEIVDESFNNNCLNFNEIFDNILASYEYMVINYNNFISSYNLYALKNGLNKENELSIDRSFGVFALSDSIE